jgi:hypothetical protein
MISVLATISVSAKIVCSGRQRYRRERQTPPGNYLKPKARIATFRVLEQGWEHLSNPQRTLKNPELNWSRATPRYIHLRLKWRRHTQANGVSTCAVRHLRGCRYSAGVEKPRWPASFARLLAAPAAGRSESAVRESICEPNISYLHHGLLGVPLEGIAQHYITSTPQSRLPACIPTHLCRCQPECRPAGQDLSCEGRPTPEYHSAVTARRAKHRWHTFVLAALCCRPVAAAAPIRFLPFCGRSELSRTCRGHKRQLQTRI